MKLDCCSGITLASRCDPQVAPSATPFLVTDTVAELLSSPGLPIDHANPPTAVRMGMPYCTSAN